MHDLNISTHRTEWIIWGQNVRYLEGMDENQKLNSELIGLSSSLKAVGYIKRVSCNDSAWWHGSHCGKNTARAERPELSTSMVRRIVQKSKPAAFWPLIRYEERRYQQDFQLPVFRVLVASAFIGTNDERSPRNSSSRDFNRNRDKTGRISPVSTRGW